MKYILDMVHHNPAEPPVQTRFLDPAHLADYGFNGQVFKHINCVVTFAASGVDCFPGGSVERAWLDQFTPGIEREIAAAKAQGLKVFYHVDLFVLPKRLVEHFRSEICDPETGRILLDRPKTLELHRVLFDELVARFPQVDGYIIRVGETYLFDTPHHIGNGPVPHLGPAWTGNYLYEETIAGRKPDAPRWTSAQVSAYVKFIRFLREELCVKHGKQLFFRTWDIYPDKLHACLDHYLDVTDQIEPHPKLAFSIKHTALDFWRHVKVNECLTQGKHLQIIEVQCQREYEGKGAYPNYVMDGVINGFEENAKKVGLKDLCSNPKIIGVYSWSRGGGFYGPYLKDELWPDLNAFVLAQFAQDPSRSEAEIFNDYARHQLKLSADDTARFRKLCLLSARAILKGRHCAAFDHVLKESVLPTACWTRDNHLGGRLHLHLVLKYLHQHDLFSEALREKSEALPLWDEIKLLADEIRWPDRDRGEFVKVSADYGRCLFQIIHQGWRVMAAGYTGEQTGHYDLKEISTAAARYAECWRNYRALAGNPHCPSLYVGQYWHWPSMTLSPGLDESVAYYERLAQENSSPTGDGSEALPDLRQALTR
ncbi:MAG: hypothetical protein WCS42_21225 [Verrucomicrobiota bacterium]